MFIAYVAVTLLAAAANIFSATLDFARYKKILIKMAKAGVSDSWITTLGLLKAAGALGLLVGIIVLPIGIAAAGGLSCSSLAPSPRTCAHTITRLVWRSCFSHWQWPRWYCDWPRCEKADKVLA
jgi:hypothetical protein